MTRINRIMMETSVYNLTQSESTGLVHYGPDNIQIVEFVRLERPEAGAVPATTTPAEAGTGQLPEPLPEPSVVRCWQDKSVIGSVVHH